MSRVVYNGKRSGGPRSPGAGGELFTPAHEENVRFIYEGERRGGGAGPSRRPLPLASRPSRVPAAWQCVERDLRSQMGAERGLVEEYVEKMPNPSLKGERRGAPRRLRPEAAAGPGRAGGGRRRGLCRPSVSLPSLPGSVQARRPERSEAEERTGREEVLRRALGADWLSPKVLKQI